MLYSDSFSGCGIGNQKRYLTLEEYYSEEGKDSLRQKLQTLLIELFSETSTEHLNFLSVQTGPGDITYNSSCSYAYTESTLLHLAEYLDMSIPNPGEVIDYITKHPGICDAVLYACLLACEEFIKNSEVSLELYYDDESQDKYLTLYIRQENYADDIIEKMDRICEEFEGELAGQSGWLLLTTDYKPPQNKV
ncbi:hypothetical protein [Methanoplanus endosymbiosus]|uniref:Uncharacterized protein n=1 Tax=Methanoplanus endosymbiosus TaxID=33865 RepID=A0A9E7TKT4_9EURY|nr:hypothetical protein [Methanoplanus endosymbiosus]UUX92970.1 hypothetical protein L6E24_02260 [Methanoplanus endosymbiosus]